MNVSQHARERLAERLAGEDVTAIVDRLERARGEKAPVARVVARFDDIRGTPWSATSNGDLVIAISQDRHVVTVMYRRSTQPLTCTNLRVTRVLDVDGTVIEKAGSSASA